jgi:hypothetical protein
MFRDFFEQTHGQVLTPAQELALNATLTDIHKGAQG